MQVTEFQGVRHRGLVSQLILYEGEAESVLDSTGLLGRFWPVSNRKIRKTNRVALLFSSRGVPAPSNWRITRLRLKALT